MLPENRVSTHPGVILSEEFLKPLGLSAEDFAAHIGVPAQIVTDIVNEKQGVTADLALLFSKALGPSPQFWMGLQTDYDLGVAMRKPLVKEVGLLPGILVGGGNVVDSAHK